MASTENVDHGKTTLLDSIRGTAVNLAEPGLITQSIGASFIPSDIIKNLCGKLLDRFKIEITIPGLLFIDTPGHESFVTLRKRGGSAADIGVLVVDINKGFQPQTDESLEFLKQFKTPFIVAATKIDLIPGWYSSPGCFLDGYENQRNSVRDELERKMYDLVAQLSSRGFEAERLDRVTDFKKQVVVVPCSGKTHEGIPDLLVMLSGIAQKFLINRLKVSDTARGSILEVKDVKGLGTTVDVILYDGIIHVGDYLVIGGEKPLVTKIKALLLPPALKELRIEKKFDSVKEVSASAGVKISAPNLENVIAGSPILCVSDKTEVEQAEKAVQQEVEEVEFERNIEGVVAKADTLGSLEALIRILQQNDIPIKKAEIGHVTKQDIVEVEPIKDDTKKVVLAFNVDVLPESDTLAREHKIKVFRNNIIYKLVEEYQEWVKKRVEREKTERLEKVVRPCRIRLIPGYVFRKSKPAVFGVEVLEGVLKNNSPMRVENGKNIGKVKQIQKEGKTVEEAKTGDKVAVSMEEPTMGRQINEGDILISVITPGNLKILKGILDKLQDDEKFLLRKWNMV